MKLLVLAHTLGQKTQAAFQNLATMEHIQFATALLGVRKTAPHGRKADAVLRKLQEVLGQSDARTITLVLVQQIVDASAERESFAQLIANGCRDLVKPVIVIDYAAGTQPLPAMVSELLPILRVVVQQGLTGTFVAISPQQLLEPSARQVVVTLFGGEPQIAPSVGRKPAMSSGTGYTVYTDSEPQQ